MAGKLSRLWADFGAAARLSYSLARASFTLRNEGSYLGVLWYLLYPLATFAVILLVHEQALVSADIPSYPAYLAVGLLVYHFFTRAAGDSISAVLSNGNLLKSVRFPREALVGSCVLQSIFSHAIEAVALLALVAGSVTFFPGLATYLAVFALLATFTFGVAFTFATVGVYVNDLKNVWVVASQLLFFVTPIFHAPTPGSFLHQLNLWNPLGYYLAAARGALLDVASPSFGDFAVLGGWALASLAVGLAVFENQKRRLAELV